MDSISKKGNNISSSSDELKTDSSTAVGIKPILKFRKLSEDATAPFRGCELAAGYDLYSAECKTVPAHGQGLLMTDISIQLPDGCYSPTSVSFTVKSETSNAFISIMVNLSGFCNLVPVTFPPSFCTLRSIMAVEANLRLCNVTLELFLAQYIEYNTVKCSAILV